MSTIHIITRSREVGQSFISSIAPTIISSIESILLVIQLKPNLLLCNGPGTCIPICIGALVNRYIGLCDTKIVFVESFCRVKVSFFFFKIQLIKKVLVVDW